MKRLIPLFLLFAVSGCGLSADFDELRVTQVPTDSDSSTDSTTGSDSSDTVTSDTDADTDADGDGDSDSDSDTDTNTGCDVEVGCAEAHWCDYPTGECNPCNSLEHCGTMCEVCDTAGEVCGDTACEPCNTAEHCGANCDPCNTNTAKPVCGETATGVFECVECTENTHCRNGSTAPFNSPLGQCTTSHECTCHVPTEKGSCVAEGDCDTDLGFTCAQDFNGTGLNDHYVCLRKCSSSPAPVNGMACASRSNSDGNTVTVWAPMTTCYAFSKFSTDCETTGAADNNKCRISATLADGICQEFGANNYQCTYGCWDGAASQDSWCPGYPADADACNNANNLCKMLP